MKKHRLPKEGNVLTRILSYTMKNIFVIIGIMVILLWSGCVEQLGPKEQACVNSGGTIKTGSCCKSVGDFPNLCSIGSCGCAPEQSHEVKICDCGEGKCFNGEKCVPRVNNFEECVKAGYPVMESYPRKCKTPDGRVFTEKLEDKYSTLSEYYDSIDYSCSKDEDCVIKDVHNCCGYFPKCVNKNTKVDPDFVRKACSKEEIGSVCGFPDIDECKCVENKCKGLRTEAISSTQAMEIAQNSECTEKGKLTGDYTYNNVSKTWWLDLEMKKEFAKENCNPACVVFEKTKNVTINWRCTGLITEK